MYDARTVHAAVLLLFLSTSFSRHSFSYACVKLNVCAMVATVHCTQVSMRVNRPCMRALGQIIPRYVHLSSNLSEFEQFQKEVIGPYFQDQHIRRYKKISDYFVEGRSPTVKRLSRSPWLHCDINGVRFPELCMIWFCFHQKF